MDSVTYARKSLEQTFNLLKPSVDGMDDAQYNFTPPGTANSVAHSHAHVISSLDFFVNGILRGQQPSWSAFAAEHGLPANPLELWKHDGQVPLAPMIEYQKRTLDDVLAYVSTLTESDLDREVDTRFFGKQTVAFVLQLAGMHTAGHAGDISAVKGFQGLKGLPF